MKWFRFVLTAAFLCLLSGDLMAQGAPAPISGQTFDPNQVSIKSVDWMKFRITPQNFYECDMAVTFTNAGSGLQFRKGDYHISFEGLLDGKMQPVDFSAFKMDEIEFKPSAETQFIFSRIKIGPTTDATIIRLLHLANLIAMPKDHDKLKMNLEIKTVNVWVPADKGWVLSPIGKGFQAELIFVPKLQKDVLLE